LDVFTRRISKQIRRNDGSGRINKTLKQLQDKGFKDDIEIMADFFQKLNDKAASYETKENKKKGETLNHQITYIKSTINFGDLEIKLKMKCRMKFFSHRFDPS
jgi:hypothetical protein